MIPNRHPDEEIQHVLQRALHAGQITDEDTSIIFYDLSHIEVQIADLVQHFPPTTLHGVAVKANPLHNILTHIQAQGVGAEVATLPELHLALQAGFAKDRIVFDSPAKTAQELEFALKLGVHINADSFPELARIATILERKNSTSTIGVRINPQVGTGTILSTSVAGDYSKFGIPLKLFRAELVESFVQYDWLRGVHLHIGSQGCAVEMLLDGVASVLDFANEVNITLGAPNRAQRIDVFDMGGGLPVAYYPDDSPTSMAQYHALLEERFPQLFGGGFRLITEFGRYIHANAGWVASRVEYVKPDDGIQTIITHVGADLFLRRSYRPEDWYHHITVVDRYGTPKSVTNKERYVIAGPLCFAGDMLAQDILLPQIEAGDYIIVHDTGAYTLSMWSRYNNRQIPKVIGYVDDGVVFEVIKERESTDDVLRFWQ